MVEADLAKAKPFVVAGLRVDKYPLHLDHGKVDAVLRTFCEPHPDRFQLAAFRGDAIVAGIAAAVMPMLWFQRCEAHVVMCRSVYPGAGVRLLHALKAWVDADMRIRRIVWPMEFDADARTLRLASLCGFQHQMTLCASYKG